MRNLKRVLGLALASVMVLSMMVVGAGAASLDDFSDKDEIVNKEAVTVLSTLNVIDGKDDGSYDPTGIVTRAEMSKIICVALNKGQDPNLGTVASYSYTDTVGHWAAAYIEYCSNLGIVAGDGTGNFNPNATVTGSEAAKMLLVAMGYKSEVEGFTGSNWAIGVNVRANQKGLYSDLSISVDAGLTRDSAAQMVYNALSTNVVTYEYTLISDGSSLSSIPELKDKNVTVLAEKFGVVTVEGVVTANEYADLNGGKAMDEGETRIVVTNHDDGQSTYTDGAKTFNVSSGKDVLGRSVTIFVKPSTTASTSTKGTVIGSVITNSDNTVVVDSGRDSLADLADDNKLELDYTTGEGDIFATQYVTNYGATEGNLTEAKTEEDGVRGEVRTIIDNNDDGVVDYVLTESYLLGKVTTYKTDDSIKLNSSTSLEYDAEDVVGFDDVAKGDYVLYAEIGGKLYVEVAESVTGDLTAYKADCAKSTLTVDGTKYNVSGLSFYNDGNKLVTGWNYDNLDKEATFYLDAEGNVIAIDGTAASDNYAFVIKTGAVGGASDDVEAKVVLDDGTTKTYILDQDNCTGIDFETLTNNSNILCTYSVSGDEISLTKVTPDYVTDTSDNSANITIKKGSATVTGITADTNAYANSSTVFFYVSPKGEYTAASATIAAMSVDEVNVYVGKDNVASLTYADDDKTDYMYVTDDGDIKAVVVVTDSVGASSNYIYLYQFLGKNSDGWLYNAIVDGVITSDVVVADSTNPGVGLYAYTTTNGFYKTKAIGNSGNVTRIDGNSVIIGDAEYTLTSDTVIANIDGSSTALDAVINEGDYVTVKAETDGDLVAVFVTLPYDASKTEISVKEANTETVSISGDIITVTGSVNASDLVTYFDKGEDVELTVLDASDSYADITSNATAVADGDKVVVTYTNASEYTLVDTYTIAIAE